MAGRDIQVDGTDRRDEIGSIWRAVAVFRDKMARSGSDTGRAASSPRKRATEERRATVLSFADNFEKRIRKVVDNVSTEAEHTGEASRGMNADDALDRRHDRARGKCGRFSPPGTSRA